MLRTLTEKEAEEFLEQENFPVVKGKTIKKIEQIKEIQKEMPFPWVMKASSEKLVHKAKEGGVIKNINSQIEAQEAFEKLEKIENFKEVMIQETASGEEIIIGIKKTPEFDKVIMFGKGGSKVEEDKDVAFRVLPIIKEDLEELIKEPRFFKILEEKQVNISIIKKILKEIAKLSKKYPNLTELDINPLFVNSKSAIIVDARVILEED